MLGFIRQGLEDFSISRETFHWGIPFPIARERRDRRSARTARGIPEAGVDLRLVRRADQLHHRRRLPGRPGGVRRSWWPADLHVIGKDITRFHTIILAGDAHERPGIEPPRKRLGPRLAAGRRRRADEQEPRQLPRPARGRGRVRRRRRALRDPARGRLRPATPRSRGTRSSAATTRTSRTTSATSSTARSRWSTGTSAASGRRRARPATSPLAEGWAGHAAGCTASSSTRCLLHDALGELWEFVGEANRTVEPEQPWALNKQAKAGDEARRRTRLARRARRPRRGVPARRAGRRAVHAVDRAAGPRRSSGTRIRTRADGNGGPPVLRAARVGRRGRAGPVTATPAPLFPRLETEAVETSPA